jgi:hypothetical protein
MPAVEEMRANLGLFRTSLRSWQANWKAQQSQSGAESSPVASSPFPTPSVPEAPARRSSRLLSRTSRRRLTARS